MSGHKAWCEVYTAESLHVCSEIMPGYTASLASRRLSSTNNGWI